MFLELEPLAGKVLYLRIKYSAALSPQICSGGGEGFAEALEEGTVAGYPVVDIKVKLVDGSFHTVDSSEMAFKIAASMAFKKGMEQASPILLEPVVDVEVVVPEEYMGDIMGDLNSRRGKIQGMGPVGGLQKIQAQVPMAEMFRYAIDLRSMTQGRGYFTQTFSHYEEVPTHIAGQVAAASREAKE